MGHDLAILAIGVFLPGIIEGGKVDFLGMVWEVAFHRIGQVGNFAVGHGTYTSNRRRVRCTAIKYPAAP